MSYVEEERGGFEAIDQLKWFPGVRTTFRQNKIPSDRM